MDRFDVLRDLVTFNGSVDTLSSNLSKFDWDYEGQAFVVTVSQVRNVLERFLAGEYSAGEMEEWANLIECREDLEFEEQHHDEIENAIYCLANPVLQREITVDSCKELLTTLV